MKYGNSELRGKFVLGPMAAYSDIAFRLLCRLRGAAMCFTEFSNANAIVRGVPESWRLMRTVEDEMPVGIQIFGSDEKVMADACSAISERVSSGSLFASCIDINFGCPANTVIRAGAGSALLRKPEKIRAIVEACVSASKTPITCKIRSGWNSDNAVGIAKIIEGAGASGITVHWRNAREGRKRKDEWGSVADVRRAVGIPVIGNGGAASPELAVRFLRETGCDAVMISSGALGNPGIFERSNALLEGKAMADAAWGEKLSSFREYRSLAERYGVLAPKPLRAHAIEFLTGQPGVKIARKRLNGAKTVDEIAAVMEEFEPASF
jgi:nifR3 family TIM-barrel protein